MNQPVPSVTIEQINKILRREFPFNIQKALEILKQYSSNGKYRVWAAIIKLSERDLNKLQENTNTAINDYRDILANAEYPEYTLKVGFDSKKFTKEEIENIYQRDQQQYLKWLNI